MTVYLYQIIGKEMNMIMTMSVQNTEKTRVFNTVNHTVSCPCCGNTGLVDSGLVNQDMKVLLCNTCGYMGKYSAREYKVYSLNEKTSTEKNLPSANG